MRFLLAAILAAAPTIAQSLVTARAGMIYMTDGPVTIDGQLVRIEPKAAAPQVNPGQVLAAPRGHAEMLMGQDAVLWIGANTQLRLDDANVDAPRVALLSGSAILEIKHSRAERRVFVDLGNQTADITNSGVYRFDRNPDKIRVWSGAATLQGPPGALTAGQSAEQGRREDFNKRDMDDLHYFAAYRSVVLEAEGGRFEAWKRRDYSGNMQKVGNYKHSGFDLVMPLPATAARAKYLVAGEAGLVNYIEGRMSFVSRPPNLPFRAGPVAIETNNGRVELFLGLGITARLNDHTRLRILETSGITPAVVLESGELMIEVAKSAENTFLTLRLDDSVTDLHKTGLYRFDAKSASVRVYGGEITTHFGEATVRTSRAQRLDLLSPQSASPFELNKEANNQDDFFRWNARRSLQLYGGNASFMSDWEPLVQPGQVKHKQYGEAFTMARPKENRSPLNMRPTTPRGKP